MINSLLRFVLKALLFVFDVFRSLLCIA